MIFLSEGAAAERGSVRIDVKAGMGHEYGVWRLTSRARWPYKAVVAILGVSLVPADFDRLISGGRLVHAVDLHRPHYWLVLAYCLLKKKQFRNHFTPTSFSTYCK